MIYFTVAHSIRHGSPPSSVNLTTTYTIISGIVVDGHLHHWEPEELSGIKSLNLRQQTQGHLRLSSFMNEIMVFKSFAPLLGVSGGPSELMQYHVFLYESVSISDRFVNESLAFIVNHRTARLNERVHSPMRNDYPHLFYWGVFFHSASRSNMDFKQSITGFTVKPSFYVESMIVSPHLDGLDQMTSSSLPSSSA